jgi:NADH:ubiquinone oxidoreductase subunit 2 (subunit N)
MSSTGFGFLLLTGFRTEYVQNLNIFMFYLIINLSAALGLYVYFIMLNEEKLTIYKLKYTKGENLTLVSLLIFLILNYTGFPPFLMFFPKILTLFSVMTGVNIFSFLVVVFTMIWAPFFYFKIWNAINFVDEELARTFNLKPFCRFVFSFLLALNLIILFNVDSGIVFLLNEGFF